MQEKYNQFFRNARRKGDGSLSEEERRLYLQILDELVLVVPALSCREIADIFGYIERSVIFFLTVCAKRKMPENRYEGCMENLLFLMEYLLHYFSHRVRKRDLLRLYEIAIHPERFRPVSMTELIRYEINTGLPEKIHFSMEYYFSG
ncbi:MAG: hypothetical protein J5518_11975 [Lachnospiraceae bacterium]|nr:hypothetical protein [Lachnospiraceae bacterium]